MNVIDWMRESARYMAADRPDIYTPATACTELFRYVEFLRKLDMPFNWVSFSSYILIRQMDDGVEEFDLTRKLSSVSLFPEEEDVLVFSHTSLSKTLSVGVNLPSPLDDPEEV